MYVHIIDHFDVETIWRCTKNEGFHYYNSDQRREMERERERESALFNIALELIGFHYTII